MLFKINEIRNIKLLTASILCVFLNPINIANAAEASFKGFFAEEVQKTSRYELELKEFKMVSLFAGIKANIYYSDTPKLIFHSSAETLDDFKVNVKNNTLNINRKLKLFQTDISKAKKNSYFDIYTPSIAGIDASAGSYISIDNLDEDDFVADLSSGSLAEINGKCKNIVIDSSSGASFKGKNLSCTDGVIDSSSGSAVRVSISDNLVADVSSGASILIVGEPKNRIIDKSSGGSIRFKKDTE